MFGIPSFSAARRPFQPQALRRRRRHDPDAVARAALKRRRKGEKFARDMARTVAGQKAAFDAIVLRSRIQRDYVRWIRTPVEG